MKAPTVQLAELAEIVSGSTPKTGVKEYWNGDIPWVTPADLTGHDSVWLESKPKRITKAGFDSCSTRMLPRGSILFSSRAPIGHCALAPYPLCTNQGFKSLVPSERLDSVYGYYALRSTTPSIVAQGRGATFAEVSTEIMENVRIPLPELSEQRRIAERLEQADRLRRTRRYALELTDTFIPAAFLRLFGDPKQNQKGWPHEYLSELCVKFSDGPFGSNLKSEHYRSSGIQVVRLNNIGTGEFFNEDKSFVSKDHFASLRKHECLPGDVLIGTLGDPNLRACIQPRELPVALNKADCVQARPDPEKANAEWLCWLLNIPTTLYLAPGMVHGQTRSRVSMGQLSELPVPVPPLALQQKFAALVGRVEHLRAVQRESLRQAEHLFQSLLAEAFAS